MKGHFDKIYIATEDTDFSNTANNERRILILAIPLIMILISYYPSLRKL